MECFPLPTMPLLSKPLMLILSSPFVKSLILSKPSPSVSLKISSPPPLKRVSKPIPQIKISSPFFAAIISLPLPPCGIA